MVNIVLTTEIISKIEPLTQTTMAVYKKVITYYSDGTSTTEEILDKVITFDCVTDWC